jgi:hypothetical protein
MSLLRVRLVVLQLVEMGDLVVGDDRMVFQPIGGEEEESLCHMVVVRQHGEGRLSRGLLFVV